MPVNSVESQKVILSIVGGRIDELINEYGAQLSQAVNDRLEETISTIVAELGEL